MDGDRSGPEPRFVAEPSAASHFAWIRTRLALERTMTSWVRTAVSLIGFGFTIVQFFEHFGEMSGVHPATQPLTPRYVGLALIGAGVLVLVVAAWQYRLTTRYMWQGYRDLAGVDAKEHRTPALSIAIVMILVGVFAFVAVATRAL
jgi:putative membrane protein